jgi:hypothetical protein
VIILCYVLRSARNNCPEWNSKDCNPATLATNPDDSRLPQGSQGFVTTTEIPISEQLSEQFTALMASWAEFEQRPTRTNILQFDET